MTNYGFDEIKPNVANPHRLLFGEEQNNKRRLFFQSNIPLNKEKKIFEKMIKTEDHCLYETLTEFVKSCMYHDIEYYTDSIDEDTVNDQIKLIIKITKEIIERLGSDYVVSKVRVEDCTRRYDDIFMKVSKHIKYEIRDDKGKILSLSAVDREIFSRRFDYICIREKELYQRCGILFWENPFRGGVIESIYDMSVYSKKHQQFRIFGQSKAESGARLTFDEKFSENCEEDDLLFLGYYYKEKTKKLFLSGYSLMITTDLSERFISKLLNEGSEDYYLRNVNDYQKDNDTCVQFLLMMIGNRDGARQNKFIYKSVIKYCSWIDLKEPLELLYNWVLDNQPKRYDTPQKISEKKVEIERTYNYFRGKNENIGNGIACLHFLANKCSTLCKDSFVSTFLQDNIKKSYNVIHDRYINPKIIGDKKGFVLQSAMGTGKGNIVKYFFENFNEKRILHLSPRRSFASNKTKEYEKYGVKNYIDGDFSADKLICSLESIHKLRNEAKFDIVILDECESIFKQFSSKTTQTNKSGIVRGFEKIALECEKIVCLDAFVSDRTTGFLDDLQIPYDVVINKCQPTRRKLKYIPMNRRFDGKKSLHLDDFVRDMDEKLEDGKKLYFVSASKTQAEYVYNQFFETYNCRLYTSNEVDSKKDFKNNINEIWTQYDLVICTTTVTVGIDFNEMYFDSAYFYTFSAETSPCIRDMVQSLMRVRKLKDNEIVYTYNPNVLGTVVNNKIHEEDIKVDVLNKIELNRRVIDSYDTNVVFEKSNNGWLISLTVKNILEDNLSRNGKTFKKCLRYYFNMAGFGDIDTENVQPEEVDEYFEEKSIERMKFDEIPDIDVLEKDEVVSRLRSETGSMLDADKLNKESFKRFFTNLEGDMSCENNFLGQVYNAIYVEKEKSIMSCIKFFRMMKTDEAFKYLAGRCNNDETFLSNDISRIHFLRKMLDKMEIDCLGTHEESIRRENIENMFGDDLSKKDVETAFNLRDRTSKDRNDFRDQIDTTNKVLGRTMMKLEKGPRSQTSVTVDGKKKRVDTTKYVLKSENKHNFDAQELFRNVTPFTVKREDGDHFIEKPKDRSERRRLRLETKQKILAKI